MREQVEDAGGIIDSWVEAFDMVLDDQGHWTYADWTKGCIEYHDRYIDIVKQWNNQITMPTS
jgi:hypothetical protein